MKRVRKAHGRAAERPVRPELPQAGGLGRFLAHPATLCLILSVLALVVYGRTADFQFIEFDDPSYVTQNVHVLRGLTWEGVRWAFFDSTGIVYWHPLTWLSLMLDRTLFQDWAGGFHLMNVLLHVLNLCLLFWLVLRLFGDVWIASVVAAVFALHPMHQESVVWITERKDVLFMFWGLLTLHGYLSWVRRGGWRLWLAFHVAFVLSLMSKSTLVVLPGILMLLDAWPLGRLDLSLLSPFHGDRSESARAWRSFLRLALEKLPLLGLAVLSAIATLLTHPSAHDQFEPSLALRLGNAVVSYAIYMWKFLVPFGLGIYYPFPTSLPAWQVLSAGLLLAAMLGAALWNIKRRPWLFLGLGWFFLGLLTVIIPPRFGMHVAQADRMAYFPFVGCSLMLAFALREAAERLFSGGRARSTALWCALGVLVCWYGGLALRSIQNWHDSASIYEQTLSVTQRNYVMDGNYGYFLLRKGDLAGAERHLLRSLEVAPNYGIALTNLANVYISTGRFRQAIAIFDRSIALDPTFWGHLGGFHYGYGLSLLYLGRYDEAEAHLRQAIAANAGAEACNDLGYILMRRGEAQKAEELFARAVEMKPGYLEARQNLMRARQVLASGKP